MIGTNQGFSGYSRQKYLDRTKQISKEISIVSCQTLDYCVCVCSIAGVLNIYNFGCNMHSSTGKHTYPPEGLGASKIYCIMWQTFRKKTTSKWNPIFLKMDHVMCQIILKSCLLSLGKAKLNEGNKKSARTHHYYQIVIG